MLERYRGKYPPPLLECRPGQPLWKSVWRFLKKLKIDLPYDPAILVLGIHPKEYKSIYKRDVYCSSLHSSQIVELPDIPNNQ
jgi:hypothetical protein